MAPVDTDSAAGIKIRAAAFVRRVALARTSVVIAEPVVPLTVPKLSLEIKWRVVVRAVSLVAVSHGGSG